MRVIRETPGRKDSSHTRKIASNPLSRTCNRYPGHLLIEHNYRRYSPKVLEDLTESADKLEKGGLIEPTDSGWCNPVVMAKKSEGFFRLCIAFRRLHGVKKKMLIICET